MRSACVAVVLAMVVACTGSRTAPAPLAPMTLAFGPFDIASGDEVTQDCVQITLHNDDYIYVNAVELTTGPGFHHSNWFYVPERTFAGADGVYNCPDRDFNEPVAAIFGGVLFAQSTQAPHEIQQFPAGVVIKIPPHSKIVTQIHLLNATEGPLHIAPSIKLTPIAEADVTTPLAGISFQDQALALPPSMASKFTVECDIATRHREILGRDPDFKIYYALAHYHTLGTGLTVEAVKEDGTAATVYSTTTHVGDVLGGPIDPPFDMTGYAKLRFSCDFFNPGSSIVRWGVGDQEMCVFLAFSDSTYNWGGGVNEVGPPENPMMVGTTMTYQNPCALFANDATR